MNSETPTHVPAQGTSTATVSTSYFGEFDTDRHLRDRFFPGKPPASWSKSAPQHPNT